MTRRVEVSVDVEASPEAVLQLIRERHGGLQWTEPSPVNSDGVVSLAAESEDGRVRIQADYDATVPYFGWVFNGLIRASMETHMRHLARTLDATAGGRSPPDPPKQSWWAAPDSMSSDQVRVIATISFLLAIVEYGNALLTQTVDFVAKTYDATNAQLGTVTAVTRVGNLIVLAGGLLADRIGRRRLLLVSVGIVMVATALSAVAPNLWTFGALQVLVNGGTNLAFLVAIVAAVEEAPESSRTYAIAIVGIAAGLGFVLGACLLPLADLHPDAWRAMYALGVVGLFFLPNISRRLTETKRFEALVARNAERGRVGEVVDRTYGGRFMLLCLTGFLTNFFFAPESQFMNRYLSDERGFSGLGILILRAATQAVPAFAAAYIGGRLAESTGRRPVARTGILVGVIAMTAFFLGGGPVLWILLAFGTAGQSLAGPSLSAFSSELFPTEVRGTAGAGLTLTAVVGSASGLLLAGYLADPLGSIGAGVAVTAIGPLIVAIFLIRHLPEATGRLLDEVSPPEV